MNYLLILIPVGISLSAYLKIINCELGKLDDQDYEELRKESGDKFTVRVDNTSQLKGGLEEAVNMVGWISSLNQTNSRSARQWWGGWQFPPYQNNQQAWSRPPPYQNNQQAWSRPPPYQNNQAWARPPYQNQYRPKPQNNFGAWGASSGQVNNYDQLLQLYYSYLQGQQGLAGWGQQAQNPWFQYPHGYPFHPWFNRDTRPPGNAMFVPCTGTEDCGEESICGDAPNYGECGQDGICVCANKDNNYDGITAEKFSTNCGLSKKTDPCGAQCGRRHTVVNDNLNAYVCIVNDENRCFCDFRANKLLDRCVSTKECGTSVCQGGVECMMGSLFGVPYPTVCNCMDGKFQATAKCLDDSFCYGLCYKGPAAKPGMACSAEVTRGPGSKNCFCGVKP
ncbi:uncharacterized protein LOC110842077 [Folsomia candida]|uniref:Uncharacterized protein n=1 Tax=Folsomia candida TaxID=158441 RepID=A0A226F445_FOLCA|nr:uncharacterized protein LOC110842077 [Folsomia candida]OXA64543.1 hypothetical protein Fcan01_00115 [Folsomia candida]